MLTRAECHVPRLEREPSAMRHGVACVEHQVQDHLLDLSWVCQDPARRAEYRDEVDGVAEHRLQQHPHAIGHLVQIERFWREYLAPAVGEELVRQLGGALCAGEHHVRVVPEGAVRREPSLQELAVTHDDDESVVEIVRNAAGELADRPELLLLPELGFEFLPGESQSPLLLNIREVGGEAVEPSLRVARGEGIHPNPPGLAVLRNHPLVELKGVDLASRDPAHRVVLRLQVVRVRRFDPHLVGVARQQLISTVPEHLGECLVDEHVASLGTRDPEDAQR